MAAFARQFTQNLVNLDLVFIFIFVFQLLIPLHHLLQLDLHLLALIFLLQDDISAYFAVFIYQAVVIEVISLLF